MSMSVERAVQWQSQLVQRMKEAYSRARHFKLSQKEFLEMRDRLVWYEVPKSLPEWVRTYVRGYSNRMHDELYERHLEFCYEVDGVIYSTWRESTHRKTQEFYDRGEGSVLNNTKGAHYWLGTDKPY